MTRYQAVLFDAFGTLFELDDPFGRLHRAVRDRLGLDRDRADVEAAFLAEASHFAAHCHEAVDAPSLRALELDCADIVVERLSLPVTPEAAVATLGDSIAYRRFDDVAPTLAELERRSVRAAVVSNWDYSLDEVLSRAGAGVRRGRHLGGDRRIEARSGTVPGGAGAARSSRRGRRCTSETRRRPTATAPARRASTSGSSTATAGGRGRSPG